MDFDLSIEQSARIDALRAAVGHLRSLSSPGLPGTHDEALAATVRADAQLTGSGVPLLDRVLLVEEAARLGAPLHPTALLLMFPLARIEPAPGPVAITVEARLSPVRGGAIAHTVLDITDRGVRFARVDAAQRLPVASGVGLNYGTVNPATFAPSPWAPPISPTLAYRLGLAAEIAGAAQAAVNHTAGYLTQRTAFGRTLASFQALRHRVSELAVDAAGTAALVHRAAWTADAASIASAVASAVSTASAAPPELHQLCGARGFTVDFGLSGWTMLLQALRVELGGSYDCAAEYADRRWADQAVSLQ